MLKTISMLETIKLLCCLILISAGTTLAEESPTGRDSAISLVGAAERNETEALQALLSRDVNVESAQVDGMTALHWAVYHENVKAADMLLKAGADANAKTRYQIMPMAIACQNGNASIAELLIDAGASVHDTLRGGETMLMIAARTGKLQPVQFLLKAGAEVNARDRKNNTALMWAAAEGNRLVVDALLAAGADYQTPLASGFTPLFFAVREGRTDTVVRLLETSVDVNDPMSGSRKRRGPNPLLLAVENAHYETALALLEAGADPDAQPEGHAALHAISWVRKPIRGDGDPPPVGSGNVSDQEFVRQIVAHGADVNARLRGGRRGKADFTTTGSTPFVLASRNGDLLLMETLLELGADPSLNNADGCTPLAAAAGVGDLGSGQESPGSEEEAIKAVERLLQLGVDINAVDDNGETAAHGAAYQNWPKLIKFLDSHGADPKLWLSKNKWGWTPLTIAHGYRKGNFRPDVATIEAIEQVVLKAGLELPSTFGNGVNANEQSWDKKPTAKPQKTSTDKKLSDKESTDKASAAIEAR